jgi:hypothetical protein
MNENTKNSWTINALLAVILVLLGGYYYHSGSTPAFAAGGGWDTDGIMAISSASDNERVVLIDTKKQNIMIYKPQTNKFRLVGARSYEYDVQLEDTEGSKIPTGNGITYMEVFKIYHELKSKAK